FRTSASAVLIARDRIIREGLLPGIDFEFFYAFDECDEMKAAGITIAMNLNKNVDVIIGPTCNNPAFVSGILSGYYNKPLFVWGLSTSSEFNDVDRFPTVSSMAVNSMSITKALRSILQHFGWDQFAYIFEKQDSDPMCETMKDDIQNTITETEGQININYLAEITSMKPETIKDVLEEVAKRARIVIVCLSEGLGHKRRFMLAALDAGYLNAEFVYILVASNSKGFSIITSALSLDGKPRPIWEDANTPGDGRNHDALLAFRSIMIISNVCSAYRYFSEQVIARMKDPPFFCTTACQETQNSASRYAGQLHDAFYAYAKALNITLSHNASDTSNGTAVLENIEMTFQGESGFMNLNANGTRNPTFYITGLSSNDTDITFASIRASEKDLNFTLLYTEEKNLWFTRGGVRPPSVPKCGFVAELCPPGFVATYLAYVIAGAVIILLCIIICIAGICYTIVNKRAEIARLNQMWQISFISLRNIATKDKNASSYRSLESNESSSKTNVDAFSERRNYCFYLYENFKNEPVAARKHGVKVRLTECDAAAFRKRFQMRQIENDNVNRFIGICYDGPQMLSLWRYCSRGSIDDVLMKSSIIMDGFFVFSLFNDIVNGISFIHQSFLHYHGYLTAKCCFVDDRWQVKVSDYGIEKLRLHDKRSLSDLLWTAPEILRDPTSTGSQEGDIYSFGIVCAQIITQSSAWNLESRKEDEDELIYMIKKGGYGAPRPSLEDHKIMDINPKLLQMIRDCWSEKPSERPPVKMVKTWMRSMNTSKSKNLMDHVFTKLESYALILENEVVDRTKELVEEKKKSDILLNRMLPRQIAEELKLGHSVEPEMYERATVFFSDVVSFTTIAARGSPLDVINLLNSLYTTFDSIIDRHDVYKVETIGDAYLCVSGIPIRNGNQHVKEICSMSLAFMESLAGFHIPYLPDEKVNLRIGIHTGAVVAGVVGLTMPRYCLFGDTVNTASRMESNGKPGVIHISADTNRLLQEVGGYQTELRGEVIIK
ncbi:hypothetical protein Angca_004723, partial [Angiostrongylus cantonensis]